MVNNKQTFLAAIDERRLSVFFSSSSCVDRDGYGHIQTHYRRRHIYRDDGCDLLREGERQRQGNIKC